LVYYRYINKEPKAQLATQYTAIKEHAFKVLSIRQKPNNGIALVQVMTAFSSSPRERVKRTLRDWIDSGQLSRGEKLPSERELAKICQVARMTARAALVELEEENLIKRGKVGRRLKPDSGSWLMTSTIIILSHERFIDLDKLHSGDETYVLASAVHKIEKYGLHFLSLNPSVSDVDSFKRMLAEKPRGVLATYSAAESLRGQALLASEKGHRVPVVVHGNAPPLDKYNRVASDQSQGSKDIVHWLVANGRKRILRLWSITEKHHWIQQRDSGYEAAVRELGIPLLQKVHVPLNRLNSQSLEDDFNHRVRVVAGYLLEHINGPGRPDAIMALNDMEAGIIATACSFLGVDPDDIIVSGYDNLWKDSPFRFLTQRQPSVTVDKNNAKLGEELVRLIFDISSPDFQSPANAKPIQRVIPHTVVDLRT